MLHPRNGARRNRITRRLAQGRVWRADEGPPAGDEMPALREELRVVAGTVPEKAVKGGAEQAGQRRDGGTPPNSPVREKTPARSRFQHVITVNDEGDDGTVEDDSAEVETRGENEDAGEARPPSPGSEDGGDFDEPEHLEGTVRLDGDLRLPRGLLPSFRYKWMG